MTETDGIAASLKGIYVAGARYVIDGLRGLPSSMTLDEGLDMVERIINEYEAER